MTDADIKVDFTPRSVVEADDEPIGLDIAEAPQQPRETGQLVYDDETGQMVDSGTWMPPKVKTTPSVGQVADQGMDEGLGVVTPQTGNDQQRLAYEERMRAKRAAEAEALRQQQLQGGGAYGDMGQEATRQEMLRQGGTQLWHWLASFFWLRPGFFWFRTFPTRSVSTQYSFVPNGAPGLQEVRLSF